MFRAHHENAPVATARDDSPTKLAAGSAAELFDFGPDLPKHVDWPVAAPPPWLQAPADVTSAPAAAAEPRSARPLPGPRSRRAAVPPGPLPPSAAATPAAVPAAGTVSDDHSDLGLRDGLSPPGTAPTDAASGGRRVDRRRPRRRRSRLAPVVVGVTAAAVISAGVAVVGMVGSGGAPALVGPDADAAAWVLANLDPAATLLTPDPLRAALAAGGHDPSRLVAYGDDTSDAAVDARCCGFLILGGSTTAAGPVAGSPGGVRAAYERSLAIATFVEDGRRAEVRQIVEGAPAEIAAAAAAERTTLAGAGRELVANDRLDLSPQARTLLLDGAVDARVVQALVGITGRHRISVSSFPAGSGETDASVLRRSVEIERIDGQAVVAGADAVRDVTSYLSAQVPPYRPAGSVLASRGGTPVLAITFPAPSPIGLLAPAR